jgi:uncharacterized Tic20 family protein
LLPITTKKPGICDPPACFIRFCWNPFWECNEYEFVAEQGREVLNFQITWSLIFIISAIILVVGIGILMLIAYGDA